MLLQLLQKSSSLARKPPAQACWRLYSVKAIDSNQTLPPSEKTPTTNKDEPVEMENPFKDEPVEMENPFKRENQICTLCGVHIDYKNSQLLSQFTSSFTGLLMPKENVNLCGKKYQELEKAVKRAQLAGFLPLLMKEPIFFDDPYLGRDWKKGRREQKQVEN